MDLKLEYNVIYQSDFPAYTATQATLVPSSDQFPQLLEWYRRQFRHTLFPGMDYC